MPILQVLAAVENARFDVVVADQLGAQVEAGVGVEAAGLSQLQRGGKAADCEPLGEAAGQREALREPAESLLPGGRQVEIQENGDENGKEDADDRRVLADGLTGAQQGPGKAVHGGAELLKDLLENRQNPGEEHDDDDGHHGDHDERVGDSAL